jgi:membrane fusion protein
MTTEPVATARHSPFRAQVLAARSDQSLGSIWIGRPLAFTLAAWVSMALVAALVAYAAWGEVTRKARVAGVLVPVGGWVTLAAPQAALLVEQRVTEGSIVGGGDALFVLNTDRSTAQGEASALIAHTMEQRRTTLQLERTLRQQYARQRMQAADERARSLTSELERAEHEAELAQRRVQLAARSVERYERLSADGFVADVQRQQKDEESLDYQARAQAAQRAVLALRRDLKTAQADRDGAAAQRDAELAQLDRSLAGVGQESAENATRSRLIVTAPRAGRITGLTQSTGAWVQGGQTLATLLPLSGGPQPQDMPLQAHLYASNRTVGFVQPGQSVWLRYAAYPYQKFGLALGEVVDLSQTPLAPQDLPMGLQAAVPAGEPLYRITVGLARQTLQAYGRAQSLRAGMALEADIVQDKRAVWEWILEPAYAVWKGRSLDKPPDKPPVGVDTGTEPIAPAASPIH